MKRFNLCLLIMYEQCVRALSVVCACMRIRKYLIFTLYPKLILSRIYLNIYWFFRVRKFLENFVNLPYSYRFEIDKIQKLILLIQIRS